VRLGLEARATEVLATDVSLPAPGQGALGIECRADDVAVRALLARAHDGGAAVAVSAERAVLEALGGDCKTPLGAYAEKVGGSMRLRAFVAELDATGTRRGERVVPWPADEEEARAIGLELGRALAQRGKH
jgi:hydroxymethylbilane synthase